MPEHSEPAGPDSYGQDAEHYLAHHPKQTRHIDRPHHWRVLKHTSPLGRWLHASHIKFHDTAAGHVISWNSREHRKGHFLRYAHRKHHWLHIPRLLGVELLNLSWWVAFLFVVGSCVWVVNGWFAFFEPCSEECNLKWEGWTGLAGGTLFEIGAVAAFLEALNAAPVVRVLPDEAAQPAVGDGSGSQQSKQSENGVAKSEKLVQRSDDVEAQQHSSSVRHMTAQPPLSSSGGGGGGSEAMRVRRGASNGAAAVVTVHQAGAHAAGMMLMQNGGSHGAQALNGHDGMQPVHQALEVGGDGVSPEHGMPGAKGFQRGGFAGTHDGTRDGKHDGKRSTASHGSHGKGGDSNGTHEVDVPASKAQHQKWRWWGAKWLDLGWLAATIQLFGATVFWIATICGVPKVLPHPETHYGIWDGLFWTPQVVGAPGFIISAAMFMLEVQKRWWAPRPLNLGWHVGLWNLVGGVGFLLSGVFGYYSYPAQKWQKWGTAFSTFWGSWAFLLGSYFQLVEALNPVH